MWSKPIGAGSGRGFSGGLRYGFSGTWWTILGGCRSISSPSFPNSVYRFARTCTLWHHLYLVWGGCHSSGGYRSVLWTSHRWVS